MTDDDPFRLYEPYECHPKTGYPYAWEGKERLLDGNPATPIIQKAAHEPIKDIVREQAGHRCIRCGHPYRTGEHGTGEWSPCDGSCTHKGPVRLTGGMGRGGVAGVYRCEPGVDVRDDLIPYVVGEGGSVTVEAQWRILTVHHLDNVKANCRWWNLCALDQRCHLEIQGKVQMSRVWPWEHSSWFRPYVAGYYAFVYEDREITREEAMERMDELLAYERGDV